MSDIPLPGAWWSRFVSSLDDRFMPTVDRSDLANRRYYVSLVGSKPLLTAEVIFTEGSVVYRVRDCPFDKIPDFAPLVHLLCAQPRAVQLDTYHRMIANRRWPQDRVLPVSAWE